MKTCFTKRLVNPLALAVIDLVPFTDGFLITRVNVPAAHRGKGVARELLAELLAEADRNDAPLLLEISPSDGLNYAQLDEWYRRHGFTAEPFSTVLVRQPK